MKILELHYSTAPAGAERVVIDLTNELVLNNDVTLCIIKDDSNPFNAYYLKEVSSKVKYINLKCKTGLGIKSLWRIYKTIKKEKPQIVHTHGDAITLFLPSLLIKSCKYFHTLHSLADKYIRGKEKLIFLYRWFYRHKITAITISEECQKSFIKLYDLHNSIKIENGRAPLKKTNQFEDVKKEIEKLKLHSDDKVFIHVARFSEAKNQRLLFNAFNKFLNKKNHAILLLIGAGYDNNEAKTLLAEASKGIYWLGTKNNICDYLLNSDFFILSSLWEGLPISLLEAMSCGVVPICTPAGGIPNIITSNKLGYLSKDFSLDSFETIINNAYLHSESFDRKYIITIFNEKYSIKHCAKLYLTTFKNQLL